MILAEEEMLEQPMESGAKWNPQIRCTRMYNDPEQINNDYNEPFTPGYACIRSGCIGCPAFRLEKVIPCELCAHKFDNWEGPSPSKIYKGLMSDGQEYYYEMQKGERVVLYA